MNMNKTPTKSPFAALPERERNDRANRSATISNIRRYLELSHLFTGNIESRIDLLKGYSSQVEEVLGMTLSQAIENVKSNKSQSQLLKILEGIK